MRDKADSWPVFSTLRYSKQDYLQWGSDGLGIY